MRNLFDVQKYSQYMNAHDGKVTISAYAQDSCPATHPIDFGYLDGFRDGELRICGRLCGK